MKCECGAASIGFTEMGIGHSSWCPMSKPAGFAPSFLHEEILNYTTWPEFCHTWRSKARSIELSSENIPVIQLDKGMIDEKLAARMRSVEVTDAPFKDQDFEDDLEKCQMYFEKSYGRLDGIRYFLTNIDLGSFKKRNIR